ncbi:spermine/spermidine synthase [Herbihabitans rhizosphaerae]|uniref:Spermine/spermidine synthase n=1 Tax=Herbihabitans rhizosphaerae TaxID=1872711 RepID=A0A4Q7KL04_9PSEU|nr:spermine/spermidine synthase [Herbihabitans rhizosphaerae]
MLRRAGEHFEVIANGTFLMDTRNGESERVLVRAAADRMPQGGRMLVGGLGVGFSLRAAIDHPRVGDIVVVERESAVIEWNRGPLREVHDDALADPTVHCVQTDLVSWLADTDQRFDALCLDIDNGPQWTVTDGNAQLYDPGLLADRLTPDGVLAVWSAADDRAFADALATAFAEVETLTVPVPRGEPDVIFLAAGTRAHA